MKSLVVSVHDVSPETWEPCHAIIEELTNHGVAVTSLLVIPNHHRRGHFLKNAPFRQWLQQQVEHGHEPVIHGYYHQRQKRAGETARDKAITKLYTAGEGEFFDIDGQQASELVVQAQAEFHEAGLKPRGFIAPAWLLSQPAETALRALGLDYTTRLTTVTDLVQQREFRSQSLVYSVRSAWRRGGSRLWNRFLLRRLQETPLLRLSLHPVDLQHREVWAQILQILAEIRKTRTPITYCQWIDATRHDLQPA